MDPALRPARGPPCRRSPWSISFPPRTPQPPTGRLCSPASMVLRDRPTPHQRACRTYGCSLLRPALAAIGRGTAGVSRFSRMEFPRMLRVSDSAASSDGSRWSPSPVSPSPSPYRVGTPDQVISELNGWPACAPVNASPAASRPPAHDSGSRWFAKPSLYGSCIRYSMPVYPGAFMVSPEFAGTRGPRNSRLQH